MYARFLFKFQRKNRINYNNIKPIKLMPSFITQKPDNSITMKQRDDLSALKG